MLIIYPENVERPSRHGSWAESAILSRNCLGFNWYQWDILTVYNLI